MVRSYVERDYRRLFEKYNYGTTIWAPLCGGVLTGKYNDGEIKEGVRYENEVSKSYMWDSYFGDNVKDKTLAILKGLKEYSEELGVTQAQLALAWTLVNKDVSTCLTGATKLSQFESNLKGLKLASEWTPEHEARMRSILTNDPEPRINWQKFQPYKQRRDISITYGLQLGKVEQKRNPITSKIE